MTTPTAPRLDLALLQQADLRAARRNRRMAWSVVGLLALSLVSIVTLVLYLQTFEQEEAERQRVADGQWLERSVRFHFRRLEEDLTVLALRARTAQQDGDAAPTVDPSALPSGALLKHPEALDVHGWVDVQGSPTPVSQAMAQDSVADPDNDAVLAVLQDTASGLRRPSYGGPMRDAEGALTDRIWLNVPVFERGDYVGSYLARISLDMALQAVVPSWFLQTHRIERGDDDALALADPINTHRRPNAYHAQLELPGTALGVYVTPITVTPPGLPRLFFAVALLVLVGLMVSVVALWRGIVKRQRVERELQAQVALRSAMENAVTTGLRAWDLQGRVLYVNRAFCELVGYAPDELLGKSAPLPYWPANQADELEVVHRSLMAQGTESLGVEVQFQHKSGHLIDVLIHEAPLTNANGEPMGWMSSVLDVTERKRVERLAAQQQDKLEAVGRLVAVGEVASTLAHELNQPLGALSGFANGLVNRFNSGRIALDEAAPVVQRMATLADKAGRIIQRVNAFARKREMAPQAMEWRPYVQRVMKPWRRERQVHWDWQLGHAEGWVNADPDLLEHAVRNLVANAVEWAQQSPQPTVRVAAVTAQGRLGLAICDNGPGVPADQREHIFSAFVTGKTDGMGMGLAICRSVVEAHHGQLEVGQDPTLGGACFTLWLPAAAPKV